MARNVDVLSYLPPVISKTEEFKYLSLAENSELTNLWDDHGFVMDNQFINDLTLYGVERLEKILKIIPLGTDTLNDRKFRILAYMNTDIPYTYRQLENMLKNLCGKDGYKLELQSSKYKLSVRIALTAAKQLIEVQKLLNRVVPANLIIDCQLLYNQHKDLASKTHKELSKFTHNQIRTEVFE